MAPSSKVTSFQGTDRTAKAFFVPASEIHEANYDLSLGRWHDLKLDWPTFLDDFQRHWPTDEDNTYVDFVAMAR